MEKEIFRDMGSKIYVSSEYGEWDNENKRGNSVVVCLTKLLGFSAGGCMKANEGHLWVKGWRIWFLI